MLDHADSEERPRPARFLVVGTALASLAAGLVIGSGLLRPDEDRTPVPQVTAQAPAPPTERSATAADAGDGPAASVSGVDAQFALEQSGAVVAATAYHLALGDLRLALDETRRDEALQAIASTSALVGLSEELAAGAAAIREGGIDVASVQLQRQVPLGYRIDSYSTEAATVAVWTLQILALGQSSAPEPHWSTTFVDLVWERDDWRLVGFRTEDGPVPELQGDGETLRTIADIEGFREYAHAPD